MKDTQDASPSSPQPAPGDGSHQGDQALERLNAFIERFGAEIGAPAAALDAEGFAEIRCGDLAMGITANPSHGSVHFLARIAPLPANPSLRFYENLLSLNFLATGPGALAIDRKRGHVYLRAMRPLRDLTYNDFQQLLHGLGVIAQQLVPQLHPESAPPPEAPAPLTNETI